jgi:RNA polymerase sigma-B factor
VTSRGPLPDATAPIDTPLPAAEEPPAAGDPPEATQEAQESPLPEGAESAEVEPPSAARWSTRDRVRERELITLLADLPEDDPQRSAARDELVTMHLPLAGFLARRFRDRGESLDDLTQVATIGLIKAVDRFDIERGVEFSTFATPTIVGEIKRHFRDKGWAIRVPRRLQELRISIGRATAELSQSTGRSPTVAELAAHIGVTDEEILEGLESAQAYATLSLDASSSDGSDEGASLVDTLGEDDPGLGEVDTRQTLHPLVATLPAREQRIIHMRFYDNMTQAQIAEQIGVSQMHVSRLLAKSLAQLRSGMAEPIS